MNVDSVLRAVVAGAATGGRTFTGLAALVVTTPGGGDSQPDATLGKTWVKGVTSALAVQEMVMDKLPQTPSRTDWVPLGGRLAAASSAGALVARRFGKAPAGDPVSPRPVVDPQTEQQRRRVDVIVGAVVAAAAAAGTSFLGARFRAFGANRFGHDWIGAVLEDAVVAGLAIAAARPASTGPARHAGPVHG